MWVKEISLENFRNFESLNTRLENGVNIVYGDNANGKTNFIEAVYFCATGRSQRAGHNRELIRFGSHEAHLQLLLEDLRIDAHISGGGKKKGIAVDHVPIKKLSQLFGLLLVVIFTPEDLRIVKAGPGERRAFMDMELCQLGGVYYHALRQYYKALKQRNNLLKSIVRDKSLAETLDVWNEPLCRFGLQIMTHRAAFIEEMDGIAAEIHSRITSGRERLALSYLPQIDGDYAEYSKKLSRSTERDIMLGSTSSGIHKDDISFTIDGKDVRSYGSQGQQRTAALSVKLAEIELIRKRTRQNPVLLLDDVLSELDEGRQNELFGHIGDLQTILTCTGVEDVLRKINGNVMRMERGQIK